ncbi:MAG TPA: OsmC family protein [Kofleriaceae bacterium]|nr:OsmC family protein [Kofleriaceae bacterium]
MAEHIAIIRWQRAGTPEDFLKGRYSREHTWTFDGGLTVPGSPAPGNVPAAFANPAAVDPEEAFVAAISSCHFLTFVWLAFKAGFVVDSYEDRAVGRMAKNERGVAWVSETTLHPSITYGGTKQPSREEEARLHHDAHDQCFIAQSVKTNITVAGF